MVTDCLRCGRALKRLKPSHAQKRLGYCSRACAGIARKQKPKTCPICGATWERRYGSTTCSPRCGYELRKRKTRHDRVCKHCGKAYRATALARVRYCSMACNRAARFAQVTLACQQCGVSFQRRVSSLAWSRRKGNRYCSADCRKAHLRGKNSPHYRGAQDPNRGRGWKRLAAAIRERDGHVCQRCTVKWEEGQKAFPVDHIIPWRMFENKTEANDPANLVTLCMACHAIKTTTAERKWLKGDVLAMEQYRKSIALPPLFAAVSEATGERKRTLVGKETAVGVLEP